MIFKVIIYLRKENKLKKFEKNIAGQTVYKRINDTILKNRYYFIRIVIISELYQISVYSQ